MKFSADGRLFVTVFGQQDVTVLGVDGDVIERIETEGKFPSNLAFGPPGSGHLYVTEGEFGRIERFEIGAEGATLFG